MALASHCTNVPEGSMWNLRGQGVTACPHPTPGHPKDSLTSPTELPAQLELGFIPKSSWAGSLHALTLPSFLREPFSFGFPSLS